MIIDREIGMKAIYGGLFLGGGGGGSLSGGLEVLEETLKYGGVKLTNIRDLDKNDIVLTASLVGSPASKEKYVGEKHYTKVYDLYRKTYDGEIAGIMTNEMGAQAITNGWMLSAMMKIPFINASCNGRAHPTGAMGSMGLSSNEDYITLQTAAGGKGKKDISIVAKGTIKATSEIIKTASIEAGGFVTVLRNPVNIEYINNNAAINSVEHAIEIGEVFISNMGNLDKIIQGLKKVMDLELICQGEVTQFQLETKDGLDVGSLSIESISEKNEVVFWNEYMTVDNRKGVRQATFPDLIAILDAQSGLPINSAELEIGRKVALVKVEKENLILGKSMFDMDLLSEAEKVINKELVKYF